MYRIDDLSCRAGRIGLGPMPGRGGDYTADLAAIRAWGPDLVISMTPEADLARHGAAGLGADLAAAGIRWRQVATEDYGVPGPAAAQEWEALAQEAARLLDGGGRVLAHCVAGCGRSGMALLRLMVEAGEVPGPALARLRAARPCAVERPAQFDWAAEPWTRGGEEGERPGATQADPVAAASFRT